MRFYIKAILRAKVKPDNDKPWFAGEVSNRDRDLLGDILAHNFDIVLQLRGDGDDGGALGHCALDELEDLLVLLAGLLLLDQVDLVLKDEDMLQLHDLNGGQMLRGLQA